MLVREVGEFSLIDRLRDQLDPSVRDQGQVGIGIGDDAAIWTPALEHDVVITTDALVDGVHFRLGWTDWWSLGHKMLAVNISDIAAMGAMPRLATIVLGLTGDEEVENLERLYQGANQLSKAYGVAIVGGDIVRSPGCLFLSVTLIGEVRSTEAIRRNGAQVGDLVIVSGTLGASAAGLSLLAHPRSVSTGDLLVASHLRPVPRVALGQLMFSGGITAAMDLSDGLLGDLRKIMAASGVSAEVNVDAIPMLPAVRALFPEQWRKFAQQGGEDYELLMTIPPPRLEEFKAAAAKVGASIHPIGRIVSAANGIELTLVEHGQRKVVHAGAFDHFAEE